MKRFLSIVLTALMIFTTVGVVSVGAEGTLEITYWNADSTKLTLDFNAEVDADELEAAITLMKGKAPVEFSVTKMGATAAPTLTETVAAVATNAAAAVKETVDDVTTQVGTKNTRTEYPWHPMTAGTGVTYLVEPKGGFEIGASYVIVIDSNLSSADDSVKLAADYVKGFKVNKIFMDTFSYDATAAAPNGIAWKGPYSNSAKMAIENESEGSSNTVGKMTQDHYFVVENINVGDLGVITYAYRSSNTELFSQRYSIEAKVKVTDTTKNHGFGFNRNNYGTTASTPYRKNLAAGIGYNSTSGKFNMSYVSKPAQDTTWTPANYEQTITYTDGREPATVTSTVPSTVASYTLYTISDNAANMNSITTSNFTYNLSVPSTGSTPFVAGEFVNVGMVVEAKSTGGNLRFNVANKDYLNYDYSGLNLEITKGGPCVDLVAYGASSANPIYIDDLIVTTCEEFEVEIVSGTVTYWNADSTKITLDLTSSPSVEALAACIQVIKDGEPVTSFTIEKKTPTTTATLADADKKDQDKGYVMPLVSETDTTYEIYPDGGIEFGAVYTVVFTPDTGDAWKKYFKVKKLWKETFDNYTEDTPWVYTGTESDVSLIDDGNGGKALSINHSGGAPYLSPAFSSSRSDGGGNLSTYDTEEKRSIKFADTGITSGEYWKTGSDARNIDEYTIELDVKINEDNNYYTKRIGVGMTNGGHNQLAYGGGGYMAVVGQNGSYQGYMLVGAFSEMREYKYTEVYGSQLNGTNTSGSAYYAAATGGVIYTTAATTRANNAYGVNGALNKITMSVKDNNIKYAIDAPDNSGFVSYDFTDNCSRSDYGLPLFSFNFNYASDTDPYVIDNIIATKAVELTETIYSELTVKDASTAEAVDSIAGLSAIDVAMTITNQIEEMPCTIVLAVYDSATETMKNVAIGDIKAIEISDDGVDITFTDIAVNGGDKLCVFVWDGFASLNPYRSPITFPTE